MAATRRHCSRKWRAQRVFHLHRFDYREALTAGDQVTDSDEKLQHPAVHRRLDDAVSPARLRGGDRNVLEAQPRLAPVTQDIDILSRRKRPCIRCRRGIAHHHMHAVLAERYRRRSRVGADEDRDFNPASAGELKAVACVPRRIGFRRLRTRSARRQGDAQHRAPRRHGRDRAGRRRARQGCGR